MKEIDKILRQISIIYLGNNVIGPFKFYDEKENKYIFSNCEIYKDKDYMICKFDDKTIDYNYNYFKELLKDYIKYAYLINENTIISGYNIHNEDYIINVKNDTVKFNENEIKINKLYEIINK